MGKRGASYEKLVRTYNRYRGRENKVECECGKQLFGCQMERHLTTKMHKTLMIQKERYKEFLVKEEEEKAQQIEDLTLVINELEKQKLELMKEKEELNLKNDKFVV